MLPLRELVLSLWTILFISNFEPTEPSKILVLLPYVSPSHYSVLRLALMELTKRGHELTVLSTHVEDATNFQRHVKVLPVNPLGNIPEESRPTFYELFNSKNVLDIQDITRQSFLFVSNGSLRSPEVVDFIKNDQMSFDLVIAEDFYMNAYYMFAYKYKAPLITFIASSSTHYINKYMGNSMQLEYVPHEFMNYYGPLSFWQKISSMFMSIIDLLIRECTLNSLHDQIAAEHFKEWPQPMPRLRDIENNISLVLINSHFTIDTVKSLPPNVIEIGGAHIKPAGNLTKDLQSILDEATNGAIYVSFGSLIKSSELPKDKVEAFLKVFSELKQTVLWKWEDDHLPNKPVNVVVRKWFPQNEILRHPNIRLFVTHGGLLSLQEAMYYAVPIVGMPVITDQHLNVAKAKIMGFGEKIDYNHLTVESLKTLLSKVLNDVSYSEKVKEISVRFRDRPQSALETAVYWIEYVIRHKGAKHLGLPSRNMSWFEYYLLDVISFIVLLLCIVIFLLRVIQKWIKKSKCCEKKTKLKSN